MQKQLLLLFTNILLFSSVSFAGKVERAFKALEIYNYFKAKELFEKKVNRHDAAAAYGLSIIYSTNNNPFYALDSAKKYIQLSEQFFPNVSDRKLQKYKEYGFDSTAILLLKDSIHHKKFKEVLKKNSIKGYNHFISNYSDAKQLEVVVSLRNELAFEQTKEIGTPEAYFMFMERYPNASQLSEARANYELSLYESITHSQSIESYSTFLEQYPESPFANKAQDEIYKRTTAKGQVIDYVEFVKNYPSNRNVNIAWRNIYKLYTREYTAEKIAEFRLDYPNYPFMDELMVDFELAAKKFYPIKRDNKYGFIDKEGSEMLPFEFDWADFFSEGIAIVEKDDFVGAINKQGTVIIPFEYSEIERFNNGIAVVSKQGKFGLINKLNQLILPLEYDEIGIFNDGLALISKNNYFGYIGKNGVIEIPLIYQSAGAFQNGYAYAEMNGKKGIINLKGEAVIDFIADWIEPFNVEGLARARVGSKYGVFANNGSMIVDFQFENISEFSNGYALVADSTNKYSFINEKGKLISTMSFDFIPEALSFSKFSKEGFAKVITKGKIGIIDTTGEKVVPAIFDAIGAYLPKGLTAVKKKGKWGYMNPETRLVISYDYEFAGEFINGKAIVRNDMGFGIINEDGKQLLPFEYNSIKWIDKLGYLVEKGMEKNLLSMNFVPILPKYYQSIEVIDENLIKCATLNSVEVYNRIKGQIVWK